MKKKVSVVIITKNQKAYLQQSLPVLLNQTFSKPYEIIVVDSGSTDGALEYCRRLNVKIVKIAPLKFNYADAFNLGADASSGQYLIRLSGDCIPLRSDFISSMIKPFKDSTIGAVFGRYVIKDSNTVYPPFWTNNDFPDYPKKIHIKFRPLSGIIEPSVKAYRNIYALAGGCCSLPRHIWQQRRFNRDLKIGEDAEYAWYLHSQGYDIYYNPQAECLHQHQPVNFVKYCYQAVLSFINLIMVVIKNSLTLSPNKHSNI